MAAIYKMRLMWTLKEDLKKAKRTMEMNRVFRDKQLTESEKYNMALNNLINLINLDQDLTLAQKSAAKVGYKECLEDMEGKIDHYFISDDCLIKFLTETPIKDFRLAKLKEEEHTVIVHTHQHAFCIFIGKDRYWKTVLNVYRDDDWINLDPEDKTHWGFARKQGAGWVDTCRFAINLLYYIDAFPEAIKPGIPDDMAKAFRQQTKDIKTKKTIGIAEKITYGGGVKSPHFRVGHFMTFYSDRYVNMKGKTIWVNDCVVKGRIAKTVERIGE